MKVSQSLRLFALLLFLMAVMNQDYLVAGEKILVPANMQETLADLEESLPGLDLVFLGSEESSKLETDYDAIISLRSYGIPAQELLRMSKKLRWVHSFSAGVENVVHIPELRDSDIILTNAKIVQGPEIGDHTFGLLLLLTRNMKHYERAMDEGWIGRAIHPTYPS